MAKNLGMIFLDEMVEFKEHKTAYEKRRTKLQKNIIAKLSDLLYVLGFNNNGKKLSAANYYKSALCINETKFYYNYDEADKTNIKLTLRYNDYHDESSTKIRHNANGPSALKERFLIKENLEIVKEYIPNLKISYQWSRVFIKFTISDYQGLLNVLREKKDELELYMEFNS